MTIDQYFEKYGIDKNNIVWITRDKITTKTYIHMISGREIVIRRLPISSLREQMDEGEFYFIGNSTIVRVDYIERIDDNNYYMVDGSMQTGAKRMQPVHNYRKHYLKVFPQATPDWRNAFRDAVYEGKTTRMLVDDKKHTVKDPR